VGLARIAAARGDLDGAITRLEPLVARLPLPENAGLLGDLYAALGRRSDAARQYDLVRTIAALNRANSVSVDLELARFESAHAGDPGGEPAAAVELARTAFARQPTVFAHDALSWALRQAGRPADALPHARSAVRLGTRDAVLWYHLASVEADLGMAREARDHLAHAFAISPYLSVRDAPTARRLAASLGLERSPVGGAAPAGPADTRMPG
jgi:tetratricopeptide (TPR) repeat protein